MKIYTRTGDKGRTHLVGGQSVPKSDLRVEAFGTLDELNAALGLALTAIDDAEIRAALEPVQMELFDLGAELATPEFNPEAQGGRACVSDDMAARMEAQIDAASMACPELQHFVIPGGSAGAAHLHVARTVCRRAERLMVALDGQDPLRPQTLMYVNRLSDLLFALARLANARAGRSDVVWTAPSGRPVFHIR